MNGVCGEGERERENYVLMFHTKRIPSCSAKEENRMRPSVPFVCLPVLICVVSQVYVCCIRAGWCVQGGACMHTWGIHAQPHQWLEPRAWSCSCLPSVGLLDPPPRHIEYI